MVSFMRQFFQMIRRKIALALLRRELILEGECRMCGRCCTELVLRQGGRGLRTEKEFRTLVAEKPVYSRFRPHDRDADGLLVFSCILQGDDGRCTDYENRPGVCRRYPGKNIYWRGDDIPARCGFRFVTRRPFGPTLYRELKRLDRK